MHMSSFPLVLLHSPHHIFSSFLIPPPTTPHHLSSPLLPYIYIHTLQGHSTPLSLSTYFFLPFPYLAFFKSLHFILAADYGKSTSKWKDACVIIGAQITLQQHRNWALPWFFLRNPDLMPFG